MLHGRGASAEDILGLAARVFRRPTSRTSRRRRRGTRGTLIRFLRRSRRTSPDSARRCARSNAWCRRCNSSTIPAERIALMGFSQGACLTLEFAARHAQRYAVIAGFSGGVIGPPGTPRDYSGLVRWHAGVPRLQRRRSAHSGRARARISRGVRAHGRARRQAHLPGDGAHHHRGRDRSGGCAARQISKLQRRACRGCARSP